MGDPLDVTAHEKVDDDDDNHEQDDEYDDDYDPKEDAYLNMFIYGKQLGKRVKWVKRVGICFDYIFSYRDFARLKDHRGQML